jgi:hypothetical protein
MICSDGFHRRAAKQSGIDHVLMLPADSSQQLIASQSEQDSASRGRSRTLHLRFVGVYGIEDDSKCTGEITNMSRIPLWLQNAHTASLTIKDGQDIFGVFDVLLNMLWLNNWRGACHDTSASLYMILSEKGLKPKLIIGEVMSTTVTFDHSWVEVDGNIFDIAVSLPDKGGADVGPPIFSTLDLDSTRPTQLEYGVRTSIGLHNHGLEVADKTLDEYSKAQNPNDDIWSLTSLIADQCELSLDANYLKRKYGHVRRVIRGQELRL